MISLSLISVTSLDLYHIALSLYNLLHSSTHPRLHFQLGESAEMSFDLMSSYISRSNKLVMN